MKRVHLILALGMLALLGLIVSLTGANFIWFHSTLPKLSIATTGQTINVLENLDFSAGRWKAYLVFHWDDLRNTQLRLPRRRVFRSDDIHLFRQMQTSWRFTCTGSDVATVQSGILFYQNGKLVYRSGIVLDEKIEGLQTPQCGWLDASDSRVISAYCQSFKPVYWPLIIL